MANTHQSPVTLNCFAEQVNSACKVINHPFTAIPQMFEDKEICTIYYQHKEFNDKMIEIGFDTVTLSCLFDENDVCISALLYLDRSNNLDHYIDYCNKVYIYSYRVGGWWIKNYFLCIKPGKDGYYFVLQPVEIIYKNRSSAPQGPRLPDHFSYFTQSCII